MAVFAQLRTFFRRVLRHAARPAREDEGAEGLVIEPYRGYGNRRELYVMGRVLRQPGAGARVDPATGDLRASLKRLLRRGARDQTITARFGTTEQRVVTDRDGYFHVHLHLREPPPATEPWQHITLRLALPSGSEAQATAAVFVPPQRARFVVISDIDDTVMYTGVANKLLMFWRLFATGAESRLAFPGVGAFYRALHGDEQNPLLYVSRGPWSIYSMLEAFFQQNRIPVGPVLFLRDWGISLRRPLPRRGRGHKLALIRQMLELYEDLPFVLIGDSGQHDPETYAQIVREQPRRVKAIYIRNVSRDDGRVQAIEALAEEVLEAGSSLLLASDSVAMAEHAAQASLVSADTPQQVAQERIRAPGARRSHPLRVLRRRTRRETQRAVKEGELDQTLREGGKEPPNTLVEAEQERGRGRSG